MKKENVISNYIVVLDDDPIVAKIIEKMSGIHVISFECVQTMIENLSQLTPIAFMIDINLGLNENGLDYIPMLSQKFPYTPIFVMTSTIEATTVASALKSGAQDFLTKPFNASELIARLNVRVDEARQRRLIENIQILDTVLNCKSKTISFHQKSLPLHNLEFEILKYLFLNFEREVKKSSIKKLCWDNVKVTTNALDRKMSNLRKIFKELSLPIAIFSKYGGIIILGRKKMSNKKIKLRLK